MPINLKLSDTVMHMADHDPMLRSWSGWKAGTSDDELYEHNRGLWFLGRPALAERLATFSHLGTVVVVVAVTGIEFIRGAPAEGAKQAIIGTVLSAGNADYDALIGHPVGADRSAVTYFTPSTRKCLCGCGDFVLGERELLPGHDQRAVRARITQRWGKARGFITWFDQTYARPPDASDDTTSDAGKG